MTSKIRLVTILFSIAMLLFFGTVPYIMFIEIGIDSINITFITASVMLLLLLAGFFAIIWLTLIVKIDKESNTITFIYPLRFSSKTINFENIVGFRYKYLSGRIEYKALQVKTKAGQTFTFSDFETRNLRDFEKEFIELFDLRKGKSFNELSQQQKDFEISTSKAFDLEQAKSIRFILYLLIAFNIVILATFAKEVIDNEIKNTTAIMIIAVLAAVLILTVNKINRFNRQIKNGA